MHFCIFLQGATPCFTITPVFHGISLPLLRCTEISIIESHIIGVTYHRLRKLWGGGLGVEHPQYFDQYFWGGAGVSFNLLPPKKSYILVNVD